MSLGTLQTINIRENRSIWDTAHCTKINTCNANIAWGHCDVACAYCSQACFDGRKSFKLKSTDIFTGYKMSDTDSLYLGGGTDQFQLRIPDSRIISLYESFYSGKGRIILWTKRIERVGALLSYNDKLRTAVTTTVESDLEHADKLSHAIPNLQRMQEITNIKVKGFKTIISLQPLLKFSKDFKYRLRDTGADIIIFGAIRGKMKNKVQLPTNEEVYDLVRYIKTETNIQIYMHKSMIAFGYLRSVLRQNIDCVLFEGDDPYRITKQDARVLEERYLKFLHGDSDFKAINRYKNWLDECKVAKGVLLTE